MIHWVNPMSTKDIISKKKPEFDDAVDFYKKDIATIRTGRASSSLVEDIEAEAYGQRMRVKELASVSIPEARTIVIQPWDKAMLEPISGAIRKSELGLAPVVDGAIIRLVIPQLTEERRKEFVKILKKKTEEAKVVIRQVREKMIKEIESAEKEGVISEDEKFSGRDEVQKLVDHYNGQLLEAESKKEQEIMN